ncbi:DUF3500 domain-containing protein [Streptomyces sp. NPDC088748]|uniref:DUF3500 domain-containing protein n=1 Tax=Streptomyces sp. NPDC088748 TaxID=3365887 RepID=UPI0038031E16
MTTPLAQAMSESALGLLRALTPGQHAAATGPFNTPDHREWTYYSGPRAGLALADMSAHQRDLALALLDTGCSAAGAKTARAIIELDAITRGAAEEGHYWIRVLGSPHPRNPWAWRINGHHLAVHTTVVGALISSTPLFFGAKPAHITHGPHAGLRTLHREEDMARALLHTFDGTQRDTAIIGLPPEDIITRADPLADPTKVPIGLSYAGMNSTQQEQLRDLVSLYLGRAPQPVADRVWQDAHDHDLTAATFAWAGSDQPGQGHYYAVRAPTFLLEYDNTQQGANHIHSVWRSFRGDWGADLLAQHFEAHHRRSNS